MAFFAFLALVPALIAVVNLVGLVADPAKITQQVRNVTVGLPQAAQQLISDQLSAITSSSRDELTVRLVVSLLVALWIASSGTSYLLMAVNLAYREEKRGFLRLRAVALLLTLGTVVFLLLALVVVGVALLYWVAPDRNPPKFRWVTPAAWRRRCCGCSALWGSASTSPSSAVTRSTARWPA